MTSLKGCTNTKKVEDHWAKQSNVTPINKTLLGICKSINPFEHDYSSKYFKSTVFLNK